MAPDTSDQRWLLLIHQIPPKPDYLRVKVGRRLQRVGAVAVKNSVYVLPNTPEALEDFQWIRSEIVEGGGDAVICQAALVDGLTDDELRGSFDEARRGGAGKGRGAPAGARPLDPAAYRGRTWVTRQGVFVDRIASAWLITRLIDPEARFKFVPARGYRPQKGELRFDMFEAEFTHEGDRCTFETLLDRFALGGDRALREIAEVVHDIDLKDAKYGRAEAAGIERVLAGITAANADDAARLERGRQLFDELYAVLSVESASGDA